jgi:hypothetical protein
MKVKDRAMPYAERLLDDRELQRDLREAVSALRSSLSRAESKRRKPSRLMDDRKFKRSAQRAASALRDASARFQGEPPKSHRGRKVLVAVFVLCGLGLAARKALTDPGLGGEADPFSRTS